MAAKWRHNTTYNETFLNQQEISNLVNLVNLVSGFFEEGGVKKIKEKQKLKKNLKKQKKKLQRTNMERNNDEINIKEQHPTSIQVR